MSNSNEEDSNVCRDFLRNVCRRGAGCKYKHPDSGGKQDNSAEEYQFCHDYQNSECTRENCKYIHCSRVEQDYFKNTGDLPPVVEEMVNKGSEMEGKIPVCRDYLKGACTRGSRCKFRHLSRGDLEFEERSRGPPSSIESRYDYSTDRYSEYDYDRVRRRPLYDYDPYSDRRSRDPPRDPLGDLREVEDENVMLRRKIDDLRKQVSDLTATNDVLLEQNARLRANKFDHTTNLMKQRRP